MSGADITISIVPDGVSVVKISLCGIPSPSIVPPTVISAPLILEVVLAT